MSEVIYLTREQMIHALTESDLERMDSDYMYDCIRFGLQGYENYDDRSLESYYNETFEHMEENYKIEKPKQEWDNAKN